MKKEYDFSKGERGKFYCPPEEIELPVYLEPKIGEALTRQAKASGTSVGELVNKLLKSDLEIAQQLAKTA